MAENPELRTTNRLPTGRAVVGGLLVTLAALSILLAGRLGRDDGLREVVVARRDLAPGMVIAADDLALVRIELDDAVDFVIDDPADAIGGVVLGPVARLEFVQQASFSMSPESRPGLAVVSLPIQPQRAPASLFPGDLVSVLVTMRGEPVETRLVADRVTVLSYDTDASDFAREAVLRLGVEDGETALRLTTSLEEGEVSIVGVTGAAGLSLPASGTLTPEIAN